MNKKRLPVLVALLISLLSLTLIIIYLLSITNDRKVTKSVRDLPEIMESKTLNVVTEYNSIDFHVAGGAFAGFQYELCRFIAQRSGLTIQIHLENDLKTAIRKLNNNVYDVIAQRIPITEENKQFLAFTVPITQNRQVLVQRKRKDTDYGLFIANQLDLANRTIHVPRNSPTILRLKNLAEEIAEPIYIKEIAGCTSEQLINRVAEKRIDYAVVDREIALKYATLFPDLDFHIDIGFTQLQAWALRKTSPLLSDSLNVWITEFKQNRSNSR